MFQSDRTGVAMAAAADSWNNGEGGTTMMLGVHAYDANVTFGASDTGQVTRTSNGGSSWVDQNIGTGGWVFDIEPEPGNNNRWVAVAGDGFVASTADGVSSLPGNATWASHKVALLAAGWPGTADVQGVAVISATTWMVGGDNGWVGRTINGGASWTVYQLGWGDVTDIDAVSATEYVATSSWGRFLRTTTSGVNAGALALELDPTNGDYQYLSDLAVGDATHIYAASRAGSTFRWNGATFAPTTQPGERAFRVQSVATSAAAPATVWMGAEHGIIFKSTDSGSTWTREHAVTGATIYS